MMNLMTEKDAKEAATIQRRRTQEDERKKRIFNPKQRLYGIDYEALQQQVADKKKREMEEEQQNQYWTDQQKRYTEIATHLEIEELEAKKKYAEEINNFRTNYQRPEDRREFDLNDPNYIKRAIPARMFDDDPRCGISSVQKFEGEDIYSKERFVVQREQLKSWLDQQMNERETADRERKAADEAYKAAVISRDQRAVQLDQLEKDCRKQLESACITYNKALVEEREYTKQENKRKEIEDNCAEKYNVLTSDMMTENPNVAQSNLGPNRQVGYLYKGMSPQEKAQIRVVQLGQIEEAKKRRECEGKLEREWQDYSNGINRSIAMMDKELARKQRDHDKAIAAENLLMSKEQKNHKEFLEKVVYTNRPTAAYYDQFNTSTR